MHALSKPPALPSSRIRIRRFGRSTPGAPTVYIFLDVLDEIVFHANYRDESSAMLLTGGFYEGPAGPYIEVQGFMEAMYVGSTRDWLTSLQHRFGIVRAHLEASGPQTSILGWVHGVPGGGAQMSADALVVHLTFFNLPQQIFFAIDPASDELAVYRRGASGRMENIGFNVVARKKEVDKLRARLADAADEEEVEAAEDEVASLTDEEAGEREASAPSEDDAQEDDAADAQEDDVAEAALAARAAKLPGASPSRVVDADEDEVEQSWTEALAGLEGDDGLVDVATTPVDVDNIQLDADVPSIEEVLLVDSEADARESLASEISLNVAAEIAAAVEVERKKLDAPKKRPNDDSFVSALKDIIQSASVKAKKEPRPVNPLDDLEALLPPARKAPRERPLFSTKAPGDLFRYKSTTIPSVHDSSQTLLATRRRGGETEADHDAATRELPEVEPSPRDQIGRAHV